MTPNVPVTPMQTERTFVLLLITLGTLYVWAGLRAIIRYHAFCRRLGECADSDEVRRHLVQGSWHPIVPIYQWWNPDIVDYCNRHPELHALRRSASSAMALPWWIVLVTSVAICAFATISILLR